ncbi:MAG TPA: AMP-binding protein [Terriglobales bacterium]|nr:AMP-binding protein [Terriglobales bacterium]
MANYYHRFLESVSKWPDVIGVEVQRQSSDHESERYTFAELRQMSDSIAQYLLQTGVQQGSRCIILAANGPRWVAAFMGTLAAGCIAVPLDTAFSSEQVRKLALDSGSIIAFVDDKHVSIAEQAGSGLDLRIIVMNGPALGHDTLDDIFSRHKAGAALPGNTIPVEVAPDYVAAILYSSGTTGDPKGVMLTHDNFYGETDSIFAAFTIGPQDSLLGILPLFHALALAINLLLPLASGSKILFLESLNTADLMKALPRVNVFICVPQFFYLIHERIWKEVATKGKAAEKAFRAMLAISSFGRRFGLNLGRVFFRKIHDLLGPKMRYLGSGGSKLDPEIGREFEALGFVMLQGYGLTETTGCAMYTPPGRVDIATIGIPLPGMEMKIVPAEIGESTDSRRQGVVEGEICIRGRIVMKGYWNRPEATAAVLDADGWLHTGDLGYADSRGFVHITGRAKEIIVTSSGKNIYPEEIEAHYRKTPYIKEICVVGVEASPGQPFAERLHGVVVPNFDLMKERKIVNAREILRYEIENLSTQLPSTKRILSYEIWQDDLPRTTTRKIKRFEVEGRVRERRETPDETGEISTVRRMTEQDRLWLEEPQVQRAMAVVRSASKTGKDEVHPDDNLELDLGLDSMERVELLVALERELGGHVEDQVVSEVYTVRELIEAVRNAVTTGGEATQRPAWDSVLHTEPDDPDVLSVSKPHGLATRFLFLMTRLVNLIARDLFHLRVEGLENLPKDGPFILSPNHQSYLDGPILIGAVPWRVFKDLFYVGTSDIFGQGLWRRIARPLKLIPVDPDANLVPAMRAGAFGLRRGKVLVLFPEGERSINGVPKNFKKGAAILAAHLGVPIVPVALDGFYEAWPRNRRFKRFAPLRIRIGTPVRPVVNNGNPEAAYENITHEVRNRVVEMWEDMHRSLYPQQAAGQHGD